MPRDGAEEIRKIIDDSEELEPKTGGGTRTKSSKHSEPADSSGTRRKRSARGTRTDAGNGTEELSSRETSDSALARSFAQRHQGDLRYVAFWNRWMRFDGSRWVADETRHAFDLVHDHCREAAQRDPQSRCTLEAAKKIGAIHTLAQADRRLAAATDIWDLDLDTINEGEGEWRR